MSFCTRTSVEVLDDRRFKLFFLPLANSDRIRKCCAGGELRKYIGVHRSEIIATRYQEVISYRKLFNELTL